MKNNIYIVLIISMILLSSSHAQTKKERDQNAIKAMCGCYEVQFNFAETFQYSENPAYIPSKTKHSRGLEWVELVEDNDARMVMQHLLIVGKPETPKVIKHWRQDWLYENTEFYMYDADQKWKFVRFPKERVKGQWTQKVFQVDDSPRYEGTATWIHADGKSYWENTTDAPLPRREYTKRNDYNLTVRNNRHEIIKNGWVHDQDNKKVIREKGKEDRVLASEKGYNLYTRVDDSRCITARNWWMDHKELWKKVRDKWDAIYAKHQDLILHSKVAGKPLSAHLYILEPDVEIKKIDQVINSFVR